MHTSVWRLAGRSLWRDLRAGELRLLLVAITLAVAALCAVGFFADRLQAGLQRDARQLLGGDAVIVSDNPSPAALKDQATQRGLTLVRMQTFPTMARAAAVQGGASRLVALKAVEPGYPLRGSLLLGSADAPVVARTIPPRGQVWVEAGLLDALSVQVGDAILLGESSVRIGQLIVSEPDRGAGFMNFAPRVLMNAADLPATELVQAASRVSYRLALAGDDARVQAYVAWAQSYIQTAGLRGVRIETLQGGRPELGQTLDRAEKFLTLIALLTALLSAVALALAARSFAQKHLDDCAMLRVLGLGQRSIAWTYTLEFTAIGVLASALGVLMGFVLHHAFVLLLAGLVQASLPAPGWWPVVFGMGMGLTLTLSFGLPPVLQLARVPALRVIRRDVGRPKPLSVGVLVAGLLGFVTLMLVASADWSLGLIALAGFAGAAAVFALVSWAAVRVVRHSVNEASAPRVLVLATRQVSARTGFAVLQVGSLALGLLALVLLVLLRTDLIASWRRATPADAPNRFVINIQPEQAAAFRQALQDAGVSGYDWYPMIRGRLVAVNGKAVSSDDFTDDRAKRLIEREFNLSHSADYPRHNQIVAGRWVRDERGAISMEEGIARTLGLALGDTLRFEVGGSGVEVRVSSLRKVDWGSLRANFFAMFPVADLPDVSATYMAAFRAPRGGFDNTLVARFPNITSIDMGSTIAQVQRVLDQVIAAVEFLFAFALVAGLVVLFAAVSATREERAREFAVMRALGASSALLRRVQGIELLGVGLLAGLLAGSTAMLLGWALARQVFGFDWVVSLWVPLCSGAGGALLALIAGWWGLREVLRRPVVQTLRSAVQ